MAGQRPLEGRVALITGGGRGLGRCAALEMARAGADVVVADLFKDDEGYAADQVVAEIVALGARGAATYDDVSDAQAAAAMASVALDTFGRLDILATFAGNARMKPILEVTPEEFDESLSVHLKGTFNSIKAALPSMLAQGWGRIITVSSRAALPRGPIQAPVPAYSAAKAGIMGLTAAVALEMERTAPGVTINCLLPSAQTQLFPMAGPRAFGGLPAAITSDPDYVAPVVAFLATEEAGAINGRFVYAAGGDICIYTPPFQVGEASCIVRKAGRWDVAELGSTLLPVVTS